MKRALLHLARATSFTAFVLTGAALLPAGCTKETIIVRQADGGAPGGDGGSSGNPPGTRPTNTPGVLDLGRVKPGTDVEFEIPKGALGFNVTSECDGEDYDPDFPHGFERVTAPDGTVVHDKYTPNGGTSSTSAASFDSIATVSVPQSENTPADLAGKWKLRVGQEGKAASTIETRVKVRIQSSGDGAYHGGQLDLVAHVPDGLKLDGKTLAASGAATSPELKRRIDDFYTVLSELLAIDRGSVSFVAAPSALSAVNGIEELVGGFSVADAPDGTQSLHMLFTNEITVPEIPEVGDVAGVSPGIPGAANVFGRGVSGIIVVTSNNSINDVLTMLHETGHFLGLNHTTEFDNSSADPLADTPRCSTITDKQYASCPDAANIMFPLGPIANPLVLSPTQKRVYRGSPVYRAFTSATKTQERVDDVAAREERAALLGRLKRTIRFSNGPVSPFDAMLAAGFCGNTRLDPQAFVRRWGEASAIAQLRAAVVDADLDPTLRRRAAATLRALGSSP